MVLFTQWHNEANVGGRQGGGYKSYTLYRPIVSEPHVVNNRKYTYYMYFPVMDYCWVSTNLKRNNCKILKPDLMVFLSYQELDR